MKDRFLAIVNPAAGGGRCGKLAPQVLDRVRQTGVDLEVSETQCAGDGTILARNAYQNGVRNFLAVGGDGTSCEIVNGIFKEPGAGGRATLGFLALGTGNSFLRDFTNCGVDYTIEAIRQRKRRKCDAVRLVHTAGELYFINLLSLGLPADAGETVNRKFKRLGEFGYMLGALVHVATLSHKTFPYRLDENQSWNRSPCLFLSFNNTKFTGGKMIIAPNADPSDGQIECVRWGPIGRLGLLWNLPRLFTGTHINHRLASRASARRVEFDLREPENVMIDGEILKLQCRSLEILPGALDVLA